jgi:hypothetical protein
VRAHWKVGDLSLAELSEAYGVSSRALQLHFAKHGIVKGSEGAAFAAAVEEKVLEAALPDKDLTSRRAKDVREAAYANSVVLEALIMSQVRLAQRDPSQVLRVASGLKALSLAAAGLERLHDLKWRALGLDKHVDETELPEIVIRDLRDEEIAEIRVQQEAEELDLGFETTDAATEEPLTPELVERDPEDDEIIEEGSLPSATPPGQSRASKQLVAGW